MEGVCELITFGLLQLLLPLLTCKKYAPSVHDHSQLVYPASELKEESIEALLCHERYKEIDKERVRDK